MHNGSGSDQPQDESSVQETERRIEAELPWEDPPPWRDSSLERIIAELAVLAAAASPAGWKACRAGGGKCSCGLIWAASGEDAICSTAALEASDSDLSQDQQAANRTFIVALRNHCQRLLTAAEDSLRWRKRCADQRRELRRYNNEDRIWVRASVLHPASKLAAQAAKLLDVVQNEALDRIVATREAARGMIMSRDEVLKEVLTVGLIAVQRADAGER